MFGIIREYLEKISYQLHRWLLLLRDGRCQVMISLALFGLGNLRAFRFGFGPGRNRLSVGGGCFSRCKLKLFGRWLRVYLEF